MSWQTIAYKDVHDASRSMTLWLLSALLVGLFLLYAVGYAVLSDGGFTEFLEEFAGLIGVFLPALGLLLGYKSIVRERTSGSLYLSLSFPHSRTDLLVGKFVGRSIVLLVPTLLGLIGVGIVVLVSYGVGDALLYPWFAFATVLYGTAFVGIAVGFSALTTAERWITIGAVGGYLLLVQLWDNFHSLTLVVLHRFDFTVLETMPDWALLFRMAKPSESYYRLVRAGFDVGHAGRYVADGAPPYVDWWMGIALLLAWILVPLALGYRRFADGDL